mmetsp:Transcript_23085/g.20497  ORF Transcript_23085/g.20497 Transcript_23085/m.20497 type:complete len:175 (-) Transcript_23085:30-554(-)
MWLIWKFINKIFERDVAALLLTSRIRIDRISATTPPYSIPKKMISTKDSTMVNMISLFKTTPDANKEEYKEDIFIQILCQMIQNQPTLKFLSVTNGEKIGEPLISTNENYRTLLRSMVNNHMLEEVSFPSGIKTDQSTDKLALEMIESRTFLEFQLNSSHLSLRRDRPIKFEYS